MNGLFILLLFSSILSIIGFIIRIYRNRNVFLLGKILSRLFLVWAVILHLQDYLHLVDILVAFIVVNLSDFIYDGFNFLLSKVKNKIFVEKFLNPFHIAKDSQIPIAIINKELGIFEYINKEFENMLQLNKNDILGKRVDNIFTGLNLDNFCGKIYYKDYTISCFEVKNGREYIVAYFY